MDIRIEKTEKAIKNAYMELRAKKPLEKITIKELCGLACINKSTFYSHYADIYALSETLELETVNSIIKSIPSALEYSSANPEILTNELCVAFLAHHSLINILFSGKEQSCLANRLETELKKIIYQQDPEYQQDIKKNILLSYCIQGAYYAFANNQTVDTDILIQVIGKITKTLRPLY